jgi:hypothetical protein
MQNYWKKILSILSILIFVIIIFTKIIHLFLKPDIKITNIIQEDTYYTVIGNLKNGNNIKVFDNNIPLDTDNNFKFDIMKYSVNQITIVASNSWDRSVTKTIFLEQNLK